MQNVKNEQQVYVGLGSNLGDSEAILLSAVRCIEAIPGVTEVKVSFFYQTPPISDIPQPDYLNAVCSFRTLLKPRDLFSCLQAIENGHGRLAKPKNAPRRIDLDILFYGNESYDDGDLKIPHPHWRERLFVLVPLFELTENLPWGESISAVIDSFPIQERTTIRKYHAYCIS